MTLSSYSISAKTSPKGEITLKGKLPTSSLSESRSN